MSPCLKLTFGDSFSKHLLSVCFGLALWGELKLQRMVQDKSKVKKHFQARVLYVGGTPWDLSSCVVQGEKCMCCNQAPSLGLLAMYDP